MSRHESYYVHVVHQQFKDRLEICTFSPKVFKYHKNENNTSQDEFLRTIAVYFATYNEHHY